MTNAHTLSAVNLVAGYGEHKIVRDMNLTIPCNKISVIIGANACGKSTLLKTLARLIRPLSGEVTLDGAAVDKIPPKRLARTLGILPQSPTAPEGITVSDLVSRGRYPYQSFMRGFGKSDNEAVAEALEIMGVAELAGHSVDELSGGQRQRVWIAMALAQQTDILLLDEPTTFLDVTHQIEILDLLTDLNMERGTTIVMVLHDINLSARYADYIFALRDGRLVSQGEPEQVVTEATIRSVFSLDCVVAEDAVSGSPVVLPKGRHHVLTDKKYAVR
ncbi:MAG: ABC transporter ATP-binding protein [Oscillospiraceae bacterium]|jgi:iron complex transport system ATP-binding protein|nr:ABC transporter ATP-binding protein [Oscillospiraceae bacterium]